MTTRTLAMGLFVFGLALGNAYCADAPSPVLTDTEYAELTSLLDDGQDTVMGLITGLTDEQWNFKQNPDRWSVAECVEHIARSEGALLETIKAIVASPPDKDWYAKTNGKAAIVRELVPNRPAQGQGPTARKAPEEIQPTEHWDRAEGIKQLYTANGAVRAYIETMDRAIKDRTQESSVPQFGWMNGYDWLNLLGAHVIRHSRQIAEVQADPNYPKKTAGAVPAIHPNPNVTDDELQALRDAIDDGQKVLVGLMTGVTDEQWNFHENPNRWSMGECVEHMARTEVAILNGIKYTAQQPPNPNWYEETKGKLELVRKVVPDRPARGEGSPFQAGGEVLPSENWDRAKGFQEFYAAHGQLRAYVETMPREIKNRTFANPFPSIGMLNTYDWLNLAALHIIRHSKQIAEIKQDPKYPK